MKTPNDHELGLVDLEYSPVGPKCGSCGAVVLSGKRCPCVLRPYFESFEKDLRKNLADLEQQILRIRRNWSQRDREGLVIQRGQEDGPRVLVIQDAIYVDLAKVLDPAVPSANAFAASPEWAAKLSMALQLAQTSPFSLKEAAEAVKALDREGVSLTRRQVLEEAARKEAEAEIASDALRARGSLLSRMRSGSWWEALGAPRLAFLYGTGVGVLCWHLAYLFPEYAAPLAAGVLAGNLLVPGALRK